MPVSNTARTFSNMLNEYLPNDLFKDELIKRDFYLTEIQKDDNWLGGNIVVPFQGAGATSIKFGGLTTQSDISEYATVRGTISGYKEVWGSLIFNETDIMQHGKISEQNFLRILPDQVDDFINSMKMQVSINLLCGPHFATVTDSTNAATGVMIVDKVDRFQIGQKSELIDSDTAKVVVYVTGIIVDTSAVTFSLTRGGAAANLAAYTTTQAAKLYHDGVLDASGVPFNQFISARSALLSAANGGSATLHGQTKTAYPALQAVNVSGAAISASNILDKLFDAWSSIKIKAKNANPEKCVMSYKHMGSIMKVIENGIVSGGGQSVTRVIAKTPKISKYGWTEIEIVGVKGSFTLVGVQEMDDDVIMFLDMSAMTFRSNGFFQKKKSPEGLEYYRIRNTNGYQLVCDICLFGEQEFRKPATCGIIYSIPNY